MCSAQGSIKQEASQKSAEAAEAPRDWVDGGPMGSEHWRGVLRGREVRLHVVGEGTGILAAGLGVRSPSAGSKNGLKKKKDKMCQ